MLDSIQRKREFTELGGDPTLMNKCQINKQIFLNDNKFMQIINPYLQKYQLYSLWRPNCEPTSMLCA